MWIRSRGQSGRPTDTGHAVFGGTGWLFADLMVALAMAFLVATTVGFPAGTKHPKHPRPVQATVQRHPIERSAVKPSQTALDFNYIDIKITIDPNDLLNNGPVTQAQIRNAISSNAEVASRCTGQLKSGCVGLVLLFGGAPMDDPPSYQYATRLDNAVWAVLKGKLGTESNLFRLAVNRDFYNTGTPTTQFELNIYVFRNA